MSARRAAAPESTFRIFSRDGTTAFRRAGVRISGVRLSVWGDFYYFLMSARWSMLLACFAGVFLCVNALFGLLFTWSGGVLNAHPGSFRDAFFFSVQTMGTIGYGVMAPDSTVAHLLVTAETMVSMIGVAMVTGMTFAKFSRPRARVLFSRVAVIAPRNRIPTLQFRVANERGNHIVEAQIRVTLVREEVTAEGERFRRLEDLRLVRARSPAFILSWTVMHAIDASSPLHGMTPEALQRMAPEILVNLVGLDGTMAQTISARHSYLAEEIVWDARFADILRIEEDGTRHVDYNRFHDTEPLQMSK